MPGILQRLGAFCVRRRRAVLATWLAVLVAVLATGAAAMGTLTDAFKIPGTESRDAIELIEARTPGVKADAAAGQVVFVAPGEEPLPAAVIATAIERIARVPGVASAAAPAVSEDGRTAYTRVTFTVAESDVTSEQTDGIERATAPARNAGLRVEFGGKVAADGSAAPIGEVLGVGVALLVLAVTFGSMLAAGLPLLTALFGVAIGVTGITIASSLTTLSSTSVTLAAMLGLAVGIDYTLFILSRHRTQVFDGMEIEASIAKAVAGAGSAVVFAGATVIIALVALLVTGVPFLAQMGLAAAATVAVDVLLSLTLVPALLGFAGARATRGKHFSARPTGTPTLGARWVAIVMRRRWPAIAVAGAALLALAVPAADLRLGLPGDDSKNPGTTERQAYDLLAEGFGPGFNGPLTIVAEVTPATAEREAARTVARLRAFPGVAAVAPVQLNPAKDLAIVSVIPASGPASEATKALVHAIRAGAGPRISVTGTTATSIDVSQRLSGALIPYLAIVIGLAWILLTIAFRSILVPLTAIAGFLLTIAATFGAVVLVFQHGFGASLIGVGQTGPIISLLPILIVGVLFGLAMDYQVFLVSRMREEFTGGASADDAIRDGFRHSARVVTAAGLIMIAVFAGFVLSDDAIVKSIGFAFATGVLIDAFVVRMTLIPALMAVLGRHAWWLPGRSSGRARSVAV